MRAQKRKRLQPYAWLGAGAITVGLGSAALIGGTGLAHADDTTSHTGSTSSASGRTGSGATTKPVRPAAGSARPKAPSPASTATTLKIAAGSGAKAMAAAGTAGPRHVLSAGELFLGGNYIELGLSPVGSFGTVSGKPAGFVGGTPPGGHPNSIGLSYDSDGFGTGSAPALDFYVPDTPEERWSVGFNNTKHAGFSSLAGNNGNATALTDVSLTDGSTGNTLQATSTATVDGSVKVTQVHSFDVNDSFYKTQVTLTNVSGATLQDVEFMRSFDPDGTRSVGGSNTTTNIVGGQYATEKYSLVTAASIAGDAYNKLTGNLAVAFLYARNDPRATVYTGGFTNSDPYAFNNLGQTNGYTTTADDAIGIIFRAGDLASGQSATFTYYTGVTTSDNPLAIVNAIATSTDSQFGAPGPGGITGRPTPEQFLRGVLSYIQTTVTRTVSSVVRTATSLVSNVSKPVGAKSPTSTDKLFDRLWNLTGAGNKDGVWVDKVDTSDGVRFVVYLGGTSSGNDQTVWANWDAYGFKLKDAQVTAIRSAIYAGGGTTESKVMLVGYSQGGLDAQNIAEKTDFNVTTVVTFGTPIIYGPSTRYETIHIGALGDPVPGLSKNPQKDQGIAAGTAYGVRTSTYKTYSSQWLNPIWEWQLHGDKNTYMQAGAAFDKYTDPKFDDVKASIKGFTGTIARSWS